MSAAQTGAQPANTVPSLLYHVTRPSLVEAIRRDGLIGTPLVFMSENIEDCLAFMAFRLGSYVDFENLDYRRLDNAPIDLIEQVRAGTQPGRIETENDPSSPGGLREVLYVGMPRIERNSHLAVITIDTTLLDRSKLRPSDDHATVIFGDVTSWMHAGDVAPEAITATSLVEL